MEENSFETRQQRRERKLRKKKEHMQRHGGGLGKIYRDAIEKRTQCKEKGFNIK